MCVLALWQGCPCCTTCGPAPPPTCWPGAGARRARQARPWTTARAASWNSATPARRLRRWAGCLQARATWWQMWYS
eukprot:scaffold54243_cov21-Tisochrysis_lutea.AAC.1